MFGDGGLSFREFAMREPLPLSTIHDAVLDFLRGRDEAVLFGAQAVNAYVDEPRMTQDVDLQSFRAAELAEEIRHYLSQRFSIAVRIRESVDGLRWRIDQVREQKDRHLVDIRQADPLPPSQRVEGVIVATPSELIASKVAALDSRRGSPQAGTDRRDLVVLVLSFPALKSDDGLVRERLIANGASSTVLLAWSELVAEEIREEDDEAGY
jgi:hypothetical protein